jgi:hypothetical protein
MEGIGDLLLTVPPVPRMPMVVEMQAKRRTGFSSRVFLPVI